MSFEKNSCVNLAQTCAATLVRIEDCRTVAKIKTFLRQTTSSTPIVIKICLSSILSVRLADIRYQLRSTKVVVPRHLKQCCAKIYKNRMACLHMPLCHFTLLSILNLFKHFSLWFDFKKSCSKCFVSRNLTKKQS
jgi:hypothetical protein